MASASRRLSSAVSGLPGKARNPSRRLSRAAEGGGSSGLAAASDQVEPSPTGAGPSGEPTDEHEPPLAFDGKVVGVIYDCFGDFEGFLLDDCSDEVHFYSKEREIEYLVRLAWRERMAITVKARRSRPHRPTSIILRRVPATHED